MDIEKIMNVLSLLGTISFSVSGAMTGIKKRVDLFGVVSLALITSIGGGMIRDLLLGLLPPKIFFNIFYIDICLTSAVTIFLISHTFDNFYQKNASILNSINNIFDAVGLGVFSVIGAQTAIDCGFSYNAFLVLFTAVITGVGGGILRDIAVCEIPLVLTKHIYAIASLGGGIVYYIFYIFNVNYTFAASLAAATTFFIRMVATHFRWNLPVA